MLNDQNKRKQELLENELSFSPRLLKRMIQTKVKSPKHNHHQNAKKFMEHSLSALPMQTASTQHLFVVLLIDSGNKKHKEI